MKVCFLITGLNTGGAEMVIYRLLKEYKTDKEKDSFDFTVISIVPPEDIGDKIKNLDIEVKSLEAKSKLNPLIAWRLYTLLKEEKPDILHTFLFHANVLGRIIGKLAGVPKIISAIRNEYFGSKMREKLVKLTKSLCDYTTVVSQYTADKMAERGVIAEDSYKVITNGVNIKELKEEDKKEKVEIRKALNLDDKYPIIIGVGSLTEQKGFSYLIKAVKTLSEKYERIFLMILGSGPKETELNKLINELSLKDQVNLVGEKDNVKDYLQLADIFVLSSLWEGMPNVLLEAQAVGLPSVATQVSGVSEIIDDGKNGTMVEPKRKEALVDGIEKTLDQTDKQKEQMRRTAKEKIKQEFSIESMTKKYINLYKKLMD
ncbi:MAG: glycosyltransferase [Candidatus Paceibacteria bacterium]